MIAIARLPVPLFACIALCMAPTLALSAPAKKAKRPPAAISVENGRSIALTAFEIAFAEPTQKPGAKATPSRKPLAKLSEPLPPGETKSLKISGASGCAYVARWKFEDAGDEGPIDICGDPKIVLTD